MINIRNLRLELAVSLFLVVIIIIAYQKLPSCDFVHFDDYKYIIENHHVKEGISRQSITWAFTVNDLAYWMPLTWLSHMLDCQLFGLNPGMHHLTNLLFHIANTLLLFVILRRMTKALWQSAFVAALFALHPLNVESVAWVAERKNVLSTFFLMLTMGAYAGYVERPAFERYFFVFCAFGLGLMAKPMLVTLPFALLLLDFWPLGRFQSAQIPDKNRPDNSKPEYFRFIRTGFFLILEKIPLLVLAAVSIWISFSSVNQLISPESVPMELRIANAIVSYICYIKKMIWPHNLAVLYPYPTILPFWQIGSAALLLAGISILALKGMKQRPYLFVGWFWFIGTLVPVIGLVQWDLWPAMADRFAYVPLIGLFIIIAWGVPEISAGWCHGRIFINISAMMLLSAMILCTFSQLNYWKNSISLFTNTIKVTHNNWVAHNNLGTALLELGRFDEAIFHYKESLKVKPEKVMILFNLGTSLSKRGRIEEAAVYFKKALKIEPENPTAHNSMANVFFSQGKFKKAAFHYKEALRIDPEYAYAHYNFGCLLFDQKKYKKALAHFAETIRIRPDYAKAYYMIGVILASQGQVPTAEKFLAKAIQIDPDFPDARKKLEILRQTIH